MTSEQAQKINLIAPPLPYTMGNGGDLIKHGLLAEFATWQCKTLKKKLTFYDPFGGRPWQQPIHEEVSSRIAKLAKCPLKQILQQENKKYIGSGHIVKKISAMHGNTIKIFSSDRESSARHDLKITGLPLIDIKEFNAENGYSILSCNIPKQKEALILIDPFYDLENINNKIIRDIINILETNFISIALYVLYDNNQIKPWDTFQKNLCNLANNKVSIISLKCSAIHNSSIKGESKFNSYIVLLSSVGYAKKDIEELSENIKTYGNNLQKAINSPIEFYSQTHP